MQSYINCKLIIVIVFSIQFVNQCVWICVINVIHIYIFIVIDFNIYCCRYRLQSDYVHDLAVACQVLCKRLKKHFENEQDFRIVCTSAIPVQELLTAVDHHFQSKILMFEQKVCCIFCFMLREIKILRAQK